MKQFNRLATACAPLVVCVAAFFLLSACAAPPKLVQIQSTFNKEQAEQLMRPGTNTVKGNAIIRRMDGVAVTCAGAAAWLIPSTDYAKEWALALFGNSLRGYNPAGFSGNKVTFINTKEFEESQRTTYCDAQGNFVFDKVADGEFFVLSMVKWQVDQYQFNIQGGTLMQRVALKGGETTSITLSTY